MCSFRRIILGASVDVEVLSARSVDEAAHGKWRRNWEDQEFQRLKSWQKSHQARADVAQRAGKSSVCAAWGGRWTGRLYQSILAKRWCTDSLGWKRSQASVRRAITSSKNKCLSPSRLWLSVSKISTRGGSQHFPTAKPLRCSNLKGRSILLPFF